jgi:hypothetical protein
MASSFRGRYLTKQTNKKTEIAPKTKFLQRFYDAGLFNSYGYKRFRILGSQTSSDCTYSELAKKKVMLTAELVVNGPCSCTNRKYFNRILDNSTLSAGKASCLVLRKPKKSVNQPEFGPRIIDFKNAFLIFNDTQSSQVLGRLRAIPTWVQ